MLRPDNSLAEVYLCTAPVDFRKGIHSLAILVEQVLALDPFSAHLFVFCNRNRTAIKLLYWESTGFVLWHKKLEQARFKWPKHHNGEVMTLTGQQLNWMLDGFDLAQLIPHQKLHYSSVL